jgi:hypothetical protein
MRLESQSAVAIANRPRPTRYTSRATSSPTPVSFPDLTTYNPQSIADLRKACTTTRASSTPTALGCPNTFSNHSLHAVQATATPEKCASNPLSPSPNPHPLREPARPPTHPPQCSAHHVVSRISTSIRRHVLSPAVEGRGHPSVSEHVLPGPGRNGGVVEECYATYEYSLGGAAEVAKSIRLCTC